MLFCVLYPRFHYLYAYHYAQMQSEHHISSSHSYIFLPILERYFQAKQQLNALSDILTHSYHFISISNAIVLNIVAVDISAIEND